MELELVDEPAEVVSADDDPEVSGAVEPDEVSPAPVEGVLDEAELSSVAVGPSPVVDVVPEPDPPSTRPPLQPMISRPVSQ